MLTEIFRLAAAGRISSALMIKIPIHLMESITINAIKIAKIFSISFTRIPRLFASARCRLTAFNLLNAKPQKISVAAKIRIR